MALWRWAASILTSLGVLVMMRWMFHAGRPRDDLRVVERVLDSAGNRVSETVEVLKRYYGPITEEMRQHWADLHFRFVNGAYDEEGT